MRIEEKSQVVDYTKASLNNESKAKKMSMA